MTTTDDAPEPFDPVVAEQFRLLDRLDPPALPDPTVVAPTGPSAMSEPVGGRRGPLVLAAAATVVVLAAVAAVALVGGGDGGSGVETVRPAADAGDGSTGEGSTTQATTSEQTALSIGGTDTGNGGDAVTTGSTEGPGSSTPGSDPDPSSTPTTVPDDEAAAPTTGSTLYSFVPTDDSIVTISGLVTEVFTDCQSHLVLAGDEVHSQDEVSCDAGSWIVVDGVRVRTSSGFTTSDQAYDRHRPDLRPGDRVTVTAVTPGGRNQYSMDCPLCSIEIEQRGAPGPGAGTGGDADPGGDDDGGPDDPAPDRGDDLNQPGGPGGRADS